MSGIDISVVMATNNASPTIAECLQSLAQQSFVSRAEIIVADCSTDGTYELVQTRFPWVKLLHFDQPMGLPELLKLAMQHAEGSVVAVTEPYCIFSPDWLEKLHQAHQSDYPVIGGAVENGRPGDLLSWACYFADYAAFMLPSERRVTHLLAGNHVSYKSWVIREALDSMHQGYRKVFLHWKLERQGMRFLFDPQLVIHYVRPNTFWGFIKRYYQHAWYFGALRIEQMSSAERVLRILTIPALPPFLLYQRLRPAIGKNRNRDRLLLSIPFLAVFALAWAMGELKGYVLGAASLSAEAYR